MYVNTSEIENIIKRADSFINDCDISVLLLNEKINDFLSFYNTNNKKKVQSLYDVLSKNIKTIDVNIENNIVILQKIVSDYEELIKDIVKPTKNEIHTKKIDI